MSRRRPRAAVVLVVAAVASWMGSAGASGRQLVAEDTGTTTPIKHFITLMQENHSFDNYFGTYPGADGLPVGTCMPIDPADPGGGCSRPHHLGGKPVLDLGHSETVFAEQFNGGAMNGFVSAFEEFPGIGDLAMGYYDDRDLPYYWNVADNYVLFDRFFTSAAGGSVWNHFYWVSGSPGNPEADSMREEGFDDVPTIFDSLQAAGITWKFYVENYDPSITFRNPSTGDKGAQLVWVPILNYNRFLDDPALSSRIVSLDTFYEDLAEGTLPSVSYIVPSGASEHPPGSIQAGERFVRTLINSLMRSSAWSSSAFMWTYDDWGGWYDHVQPPRVDEYGYGFRAPALLVSPYAKRGHVDSTEMDFTSMLRFIEENWGLAPLAERDAAANNFLSAFDFARGPREPILLDRARVDEPLPDPRTMVVYVAYSSALAVPVVILLAAAIGRFVRRGRRTPHVRAQAGS